MLCVAMECKNRSARDKTPGLGIKVARNDAFSMDCSGSLNHSNSDVSLRNVLNSVWKKWICVCDLWNNLTFGAWHTRSEAIRYEIKFECGPDQMKCVRLSKWQLEWSSSSAAHTFSVRYRFIVKELARRAALRQQQRLMQRSWTIHRLKASCISICIQFLL